ADEPSPQPREIAFAGVGEFTVQAFGQQQVQYRVAEEFQPFVVGTFGTAVRERNHEQAQVARLVAEPGGEQLRLGCRRRAHGLRIYSMATVFLKDITSPRLPNSGATSS